MLLSDKSITINFLPCKIHANYTRASSSLILETSQATQFASEPKAGQSRIQDGKQIIYFSRTI